jgi:aryl-alcohol dehydrogenase-like predicted oxidoreductase
MNKRVLGRTGLEVSEISLGGLFLASWFNDQAGATAVVKRAIERGINYIDTAPMYGNSEEQLGGALREIDAPLVLSTKFGARPMPFDAKDKDALFASFEESMRLLGRERVDMLMIHEPDRPRQFDWWEDLDTAVGPVMEVIDTLKKDGRIDYIGLGGTTAYEMARLINTGKFDVVLTAFNYSLLWREAEIDVLPAAKAHNVGVIIGSPLQQGALSQRFDDQVNNGAPWLSSPRRKQYKALYALLDDIKMPIAECAMRFVISNPVVHTILTGSRSPEEVDLNVESIAKGPLPADVLKRLDEIAAMVPFRPFGEPFGLPFGNPAYKGPGQA